MKEQFFRGLEGWLGRARLEARLDNSHSANAPQRAAMCAERLLGLPEWCRVLLAIKDAAGALLFTLKYYMVFS